VEAIRGTDFSGEKDWAYYSALGWMRKGMESVFLQDANSMIIKPDVMVELLTFLRQQFPEIRRITSYARSHTISRISEEDLRRIAEVGLNRVHIGMETASDTVLKLVKKGTCQSALNIDPLSAPNFDPLTLERIRLNPGHIQRRRSSSCIHLARRHRGGCRGFSIDHRRFEERLFGAAP